MKFLYIILLIFIPQKEKSIIFFGDSITAGYGVDPTYRFTTLIDNKLKSEKKNYSVINAGLSGETTAGGLRRVSWILKQPCDIFVLCLGGNDGLRGFDTAFSKNNLGKIIDIVRKKKPHVKILLMGMEAPPNMGKDYTASFRSIFKEIAKEKKTAFIPFILEGVGGNPDLNINDRIHPNEKGHKILAKTVWETLKTML